MALAFTFNSFTSLDTEIVYIVTSGLKSISPLDNSILESKLLVSSPLLLVIPRVYVLIVPSSALILIYTVLAPCFKVTFLGAYPLTKLALLSSRLAFIVTSLIFLGTNKE